MSTATRSNSTASGEQLRIELALEGEDGERWRVRVGLRPSQRSVHIDGATVALCDQDGRLLGPAVVLPVVGEISDEVELYTGVQGPHPLRAGSALRCTVFFSSGQQPQEHEVVVVQRRGFSAWRTAIFCSSSSRRLRYLRWMGVKRSAYSASSRWLIGAVKMGRSR